MKCRKKHCKYLTPEIIGNIKWKNKLYAVYIKALKEGSQVDIDRAKKQYTQIRNEVNKSLKLARKSYYEGGFNQTESSKDYWRVFKEFKGNSNTITSNSIVVSEDCSNMSLCNFILNFFCEKIRNIKSSIRGIPQEPILIL